MKRRSWYLRVGLVLTAGMFLLALIGAIHTPYDPAQMSAQDRFAPPSAAHPFGCDWMGRDVLSRTLAGLCTTAVIALSAVAIGFTLGLLIGAPCGYLGGVPDAVVMRICDAVAAFPSLLLAMVFIAVTGAGKYKLIPVLGVLFVPSFARLVRGEFLKYRDRDFVNAARLMGVGRGRILFVHILPNTAGVLLSGLTIGFNNAVLAESSMSYLGIGVTPPDASLGRMLSEAQGYLASAPWATAFPALAVVLLILGVALTGEGMRERTARV